MCVLEAMKDQFPHDGIMTFRLWHDEILLVILNFIAGFARCSMFLVCVKLLCSCPLGVVDDPEVGFVVVAGRHHGNQRLGVGAETEIACL